MDVMTDFGVDIRMPEHRRYSLKVGSDLDARLNKFANQQGCYPDTVLSDFIKAELPQFLDEQSVFNKTPARQKVYARWRGRKFTRKHLDCFRALICLKQAKTERVHLAFFVTHEAIASQMECGSKHSVIRLMASLEKKGAIKQMAIKRVPTIDGERMTDLLAITLIAELAEFEVMA